MRYVSAAIWSWPGLIPASGDVEQLQADLGLVWQVLEETAKMLKRHKQRFLGDLHVDQQKLRAQLEVLRSDVEAFSELGDIAQVLAQAAETPWHALWKESGTVTAGDILPSRFHCFSVQ